MSDDAIAQGFADCEALVVAMLIKASDEAAAAFETLGRRAENLPESERQHVLPLVERACHRVQAFREAALAVSLGQHRSAETNDLAVLSAHRTAVNRAQAQAGGRASAAKRWGPKGAKS